MAKQVAFPGTLTKGGSTVGSAKVIKPPELTTNKVRIDGMDSDYTLNAPSKKRDWGDVAVTIIPAATELTTIYTDLVAETIGACVLTDPKNTYTFSGWYLSAAPNEISNDANEAVMLDVVIAVYGDVIVTATA
jgi:hypothetical protein